MSSINSTDKQLNPIVAAGAVVVHEKKVLLVKRSKAPSKGLWAIPGGKIRAGETIQSAAEREILEETGLTINAGAPIYAFDLIEREDNDIRYHYVIVDVIATLSGGTLAANSDAQECQWFGMSDLDQDTVDKNTFLFLNNNPALFE